MGLGLALLLGMFLSPFASQSPDGLEKVAADKGFLQKGEVAPTLAAPIPDYAMPGIKREGAATAAAGLLGTLIAFAAACAAGALVKRMRDSKRPDPDANIV